LTLNNVNITLNTAAGISVNGTFDGDVCYINLVGDNHLDVANYYPLIVRKATTITGNGTLDMGSGDISVRLSAPLVFEGGCTVMGNSIMGSSSDGETLAIRGSETSVIMSYTIWGFASLTLNDGLLILKPQGGYYDPSSRWMKNANGTNCTSGVTINNGRQMYAERSAENNGSVTLKFYYDTQRNTRPGITYDLNSSMDNPGWYSDGSSYGVTKVVFDPSFASTRPTSTNHWFAEMYYLTSIEGIQYLNTSEVTNMASMFWECGALTAVDVSGFDTRKVTDMSAMFAECYELTALDVSGWNTSYVTDMSWMFSDCSELTSLDVSHFNTSNVTNMRQLFDGCSGLTSLDVSNFDTSNVTDMSWMFSWCNGLQQLDLSGFNTSKVTNMSSMFNECETLRTIYVGDSWTTAAVTSSSSMFDVCHSLVGGKGTTYSSSNPKDKTYAHIDGGTSNPGYFSEKGGTFLRGDVNGDGSVNISDVTALIDYLLSGNASGINLSGADCNQDGSINISDVTALIDYLLSGTWN
jgi:surface protein